MLKWIHHLLEPHCAACAAEKQDDKVCQSCETLKLQLEIANFEKKQLLDSILVKSPPVQVERQESPQQVAPRTIPWAVRRQMLEAEDKKQAALIAESNKQAANLPRGESGGLKAEIDDLEKELGLEEGAK